MRITILVELTLAVAVAASPLTAHPVARTTAATANPTSSLCTGGRVFVGWLDKPFGILPQCKCPKSLGWDENRGRCISPPLIPPILRVGQKIICAADSTLYCDYDKDNDLCLNNTQNVVLAVVNSISKTQLKKQIQEECKKKPKCPAGQTWTEKDKKCKSPCLPKESDKKHWKEYEKMMARSAESERRREAEKMTKSNDRDVTANGLMRIWEDSIIPRWSDAIRERRTRELWWRGVASRSRGVVWSRAIGNELGLTPNSFKAALGRAHDVDSRVKAGKGDAEDIRKEAWLSKIREDVNENTWRDLRIFQVGGPLHQSLVDLLSAYAMYRSDIGYVAGCNTVGALLLLNLPNPSSAFIALANVLNRPLSLGFYASDPGAKASAYNLVLQTLQVKSPGLHEHLTRDVPDADPEVYLNTIFTGLGTSHLAMDECARLWDVYVFEGDALLVRAATAMLLRQEMALLGTRDGDEVRKLVESGPTKNGKVALAGGSGDEEGWMRWLREAGKA
ncbi:hypothetical protein BN1723_012688 [Verticillium longisporum]|uniref:Rab-GAP TBC domain-containing protein n=1 Tax=Verticillium longisporum TaxID=100787 RepID=A0A0G4LLF2_VERLO|nr:hypothetical protein BN1723_012688 [Verticillium longisporum]